MKETLQKLALLPLFVGLFVMTACNDNSNDLWYDDIPSGRFDGTITAVVQDGSVFNPLIQNVVAVMYWEQGDDDGNEEVIAIGEWSDGGFTITLPAILNNRFLFSIGDVFDDHGLMVSDRDARVSEPVYFYAVNANFDPNNLDDDGIVGSFWYALESQNLSADVFFVFADRNVTITGTIALGANDRALYSIFLERGWNKIYEIDRRTATGWDYVSTTEPISGLNWSFNCWDCPDILIPVTGVLLNPPAATLTSIGQTVTLTATVQPGNATNRDITWWSDNDAIATVENGVVTARGEGTATITVRTVDGGRTANSFVTVSLGGGPPPPPPTGQTVAITADVQQSAQFGFVERVRAAIEWPIEETVAQSSFVSTGNANFVLTLAQTPHTDNLISALELVEEGLTVSDPSANLSIFDLSILGYTSSSGAFDENDIAGRFSRGAAFTSSNLMIFQEVIYVYADRDVTIQGVMWGDDWIDSWDIVLQRGWNEVFMQNAFDQDTGFENGSITSDYLPNLTWQFDCWICNGGFASPMSTRTHERRMLRR